MCTVLDFSEPNRTAKKNWNRTVEKISRAEPNRQKVNILAQKSIFFPFCAEKVQKSENFLEPEPIRTAKKLLEPREPNHRFGSVKNRTMHTTDA
jgi:hypothetical protein